eukprot:3391156-Amphidinium_carterae.1
MEDVLKTAVKESGALDVSPFKEGSRITSSLARSRQMQSALHPLQVRSYFRRALFKPPWDDQTFKVYFQSRPNVWDFDEQTGGVRLQTDLTRQISEVPCVLTLVVLSLDHPCVRPGHAQTTQERPFS